MLTYRKPGKILSVMSDMLDIASIEALDPVCFEMFEPEDVRLLIAITLCLTFILSNDASDVMLQHNYHGKSFSLDLMSVSVRYDCFYCRIFRSYAYGMRIATRSARPGLGRNMAISTEPPVHTDETETTAEAGVGTAGLGAMGVCGMTTQRAALQAVV